MSFPERCPSCGSGIAAKGRVCENCNRLPAVCPSVHCGKAVPAHALHCVYCGEAVATLEAIAGQLAVKYRPVTGRTNVAAPGRAPSAMALRMNDREVEVAKVEPSGDGNPGSTYEVMLAGMPRSVSVKAADVIRAIQAGEEFVDVR